MADRERAVTDLERMRQTHVEWRDHLKPRSKRRKGPHCGECAATNVEAVVGDVAHHEACIEAYDNALSILTQQTKGRKP